MYGIMVFLAIIGGGVLLLVGGCLLLEVIQSIIGNQFLAAKEEARQAWKIINREPLLWGVVDATGVLKETRESEEEARKTISEHGDRVVRLIGV